MTTPRQSIARPLAGLRVLDFTALLPGPLCTLHLADMAAAACPDSSSPSCS